MSRPPVTLVVTSLSECLHEWVPNATCDVGVVWDDSSGSCQSSSSSACAMSP